MVREPRRAVEQVMSESGPYDVIVVTGSVYLVGDLPILPQATGPVGAIS